MIYDSLNEFFGTQPPYEMRLAGTTIRMRYSGEENVIYVERKVKGLWEPLMWYDPELNKMIAVSSEFDAIISITAPKKGGL